jgi:hypothetical protein
MSNEIFSLLIQCWHSAQTDVMQLRVVRADTGEEIHLNDGTFLLRIFSDTGSSALRCLIRHLASGREAYIQSGLTMRTFIKTCLLADSAPPEAPGEQTDNQDTSKDT